MDQGSLGAPRFLDSEILIDVESESTDEQITQQAVPDEELDDAGMRSGEEQAAGIDIENMEVEPEKVDQSAEQEHYSNEYLEYLAVPSNKATNLPAPCLNTEEVARVFDEVLAYLIFQRKHLVDDYVALSFKEMKERKDEFRTPSAAKPFHCPAFLDEESKDEYFKWIRGEGLKMCQKARNPETNG